MFARSALSCLLLAGAALPRGVACVEVQQAPAAFEAMPTWGAIVLVVGTYLLVLFSFAMISRSLTTTSTGDTWSLADAVSEETEIVVDGTKKTILLASSSRLIALLGLVVLLVAFLGFGVIAMWSLAESGSMPSLAEVSKFLVGGATLFLPYGINQVRTALEAFGNKP